MARTRTFTFDVRFRERSDLAGVLDMMRYDNARVSSWGYPDDGRFWTVTLVTDRPPTTDRWQSFGLRPLNVQERSF